MKGLFPFLRELFFGPDIPPGYIVVYCFESEVGETQFQNAVIFNTTVHDWLWGMNERQYCREYTLINAWPINDAEALEKHLGTDK